MPYAWPKDTDFALWELDVLDRNCPVCGRMMYVCDHRYRRFHTLNGPVELICRLNHCPDVTCPGHTQTKSPELEVTIALPKWAVGWDVLCWIGHRRCSRHWSISQIQSELWDSYSIKLSADSIARYIRHYQIMLSARQEDPDIPPQYTIVIRGPRTMRPSTEARPLSDATARVTPQRRQAPRPQAPPRPGCR